MSLSITDDRGVSRAFVPSEQHQAWWDTKDASQRLQAGSAGNLAIATACGVMGLFAPEMVRTSNRQQLNWTFLGFAITYVLLFGAVLHLIHRRKRSRRVSEVRRTCLKRGICPACAYAIAGIAPAPDGCRVCPECGGAWRQHTGQRPVMPS